MLNCAQPVDVSIKYKRDRKACRIKLEDIDESNSGFEILCS